MKGERQHKLTNEQLPYEIEFEESRRKLEESIQLLQEHERYLQKQISASQTLIQEITRDTSKTVLKLREQRKFMMEFGEDEEHMFKNYGEDTRLAKNRRSAVKDIIEQYEHIYSELKNNKTSKDPLSEIQNRNEVGNLHFAAGSYGKAEEFWEDALATIFKTVRPVENYLEIFRRRGGLLVNEIGWRETVLSLNLLYKIAQLGSFRKLHYQYNCTKFAIKLSNALF
jgi:chromosome segregation ATPase